MKKAVSGLAKILLVLIIMVCLSILIFISFIFLDSKSNKIEQNNSLKELNYYLPEDFAVIEVTFDSLDYVNLFGVIISLEDEKGKIYSYKKQEPIRLGETKRYTLLTKDISPKVPSDWNFTKVRSISLRYLTENNKPSRVIQRIAIDPSKISTSFKQECYLQKGKVVCN